MILRNNENQWQEIIHAVRSYDRNDDMINDCKWMNEWIKGENDTLEVYHQAYWRKTPGEEQILWGDERNNDDDDDKNKQQRMMMMLCLWWWVNLRGPFLYNLQE